MFKIRMVLISLRALAGPICILPVEDMMKSSPICLLSKASKNKYWLWHRRLNHLNFGTINDLARKDLVRGLPRLKFKKDHLCFACQLGKSKTHTYKPKAENTNLEVLNTLHMDLCGPMLTTRFTPPQVVSVAQSKKQANTCANQKEPNHNWGSKVSNSPSLSGFKCRSYRSSFVQFGNDHFGAIMGYGDCVVGESVISRVYYVEGLGHNLFFVRQFCDSDLEVTFRKHSCYVQDTNGVDLIKGFRRTNLFCLIPDQEGVSYGTSTAKV
nr:retrovirus-related Pol polyprotein from transposon TNT 1-94 [Tanacetum cinerariifolium]